MNDDKRIKRKVLRSYIVSTISISLVLFLLGSVGYMLYSAYITSKDLRENVTLSVEIEDQLDSEATNELEERIKSNPAVSKVLFSSKEEKLNDEEFRQMFGQEIVEVLGENPLRNSFEVSIKAAQREKMDSIVSSLEQLEGVVYVAYPATTIENMHSTLRRIMIILVTFGGALFIISLILLNNTIRLAIYSRRHLINTFKLVGATKWYIMKPLLWTSVKQGFWSGIIASLLFVGALFGLREALPEIISLSSLTKYGVVIGAIIVAGLVISVLFTTFAVNKFVNMKSNKIRLY